MILPKLIPILFSFAVSDRFFTYAPIRINKNLIGGKINNNRAYDYIVSGNVGFINNLGVGVQDVRIFDNNQENTMIPLIDSLTGIITPVNKISGTVAPVSGIWFRGDVCQNATPSAAGVPGWMCINRQDIQMRIQANATDTIMEVDATAGMLATDVIGITLDDDSIHWSTINAITDADTLVLDDAIPAGRNAPVDAGVFTNRWKAMASLAA